LTSDLEAAVPTYMTNICASFVEVPPLSTETTRYTKYLLTDNRRPDWRTLTRQTDSRTEYPKTMVWEPYYYPPGGGCASFATGGCAE